VPLKSFEPQHRQIVDLEVSLRKPAGFADRGLALSTTERVPSDFAKSEFRFDSANDGLFEAIAPVTFEEGRAAGLWQSAHWADDNGAALFR
jgi:hypothetical protein